MDERFNSVPEDDRFGADNRRTLEDLNLHGYSTDVYRYIDEGWKIFMKNPLYFILFTLLYIAIGFALMKLRFGTIGEIFITPCLWAGYMLVARRLSFNQHVDFKDFFSGFNQWDRLVPVSFIATVFMVIGLIFLVLPGIYLAVGYLFIAPLVLFYPRELSLLEILEGSRQVITKKWWNFLGFAGLLLLINIVGIICLGVGILVSFPVSICAIYAAYEDVFGVVPDKW